MYEVKNSISQMVLPPVVAAEKMRAETRIPNRDADVRGRILNVRSGRIRPRRYSPMPYGGVNRRQPRDQRRMTQSPDGLEDRVVTLLVPAGSRLDRMTGKEVLLKFLP
ncbi:MAG: hypothetical protein JXR89_07460 [Deltaproteobacteria bacterium]|nr:hypothetical protein [Deltaproteobacteria bacterium]